MKNKIRLGIIFGGRSAEHEVSLISARNVYAAVDQDKYEISLIGIDKEGGWHMCTPETLQLGSSNPKLVALNGGGAAVTAVATRAGTELVDLDHGGAVGTLDVIFPVLHGTYGEDGTMQGLLKLANVPFVGPSVLGSAIGMDKDVAKRLLRDAGIPVARSITLKSFEKKADFEAIKNQLGLPLFVKPANAGSSVGVSRATDRASFDKAVELAFQFDRKILVEEAIVGKEVEVSVLGNDDPIASLPGIVVADEKHGFYSYDAKYVDENGATMEIPAKLPADQIKLVQELAVKTFKALELQGMSRVDFFLTAEGKAIVNEVNTIPGFTSISMYPKLWEVSGLPYRELIQRLIDLAIERHQAEKALRTEM